MFEVDRFRKQFPALNRTVNQRPAIYFDGPAGSQVPQRVADAVADYLLRTNANHGGLFASARESDAILRDAHDLLADFLGAESGDCIAFGANMTTLTFALSRALAKTWNAGDEVVVTRLDHDANVTPWTLAARDAGATVRHLDIHPEDGTLDLDQFAQLLNERTKLVAVGYASNAVGTINPIADIVAKSHAVGALTFVDAVHYAPHGRIDVAALDAPAAAHPSRAAALDAPAAAHPSRAAALDCDFLACSAYKFFGPHVGVLYGKRELLERLQPYKLRPASNALPERWMTGTQSHEGIAGAAEAVRYLADVGRGVDPSAKDTRAALDAAFEAIGEHERALAKRLIAGLQSLSGVRIWGLTDPRRLHERVPTVSITHRSLSPAEIAEHLARRGIFAWHGNHYALPFTEAANLEPEGTLRLGLLHYNTSAEVDVCLRELGEILRAG